MQQKYTSRCCEPDIQQLVNRTAFAVSGVVPLTCVPPCCATLLLQTSALRACRWINNAGQVTPRKLLHELQPSDIASAVGCNVLGSLLCCRAAIALMKQHHEQQPRQQSPAQQDPQYHIFK